MQRRIFTTPGPHTPSFLPTQQIRLVSTSIDIYFPLEGFSFVELSDKQETPQQQTQCPCDDTNIANDIGTICTGEWNRRLSDQVQRGEGGKDLAPGRV
jgi:hypothetical protein